MLVQVRFIGIDFTGHADPADKNLTVSRVTFDLDVGRAHFLNLYVEVKHPWEVRVGEAPAEIGPIHGYAGPFHEVSFRRAVADYFRRATALPGGSMTVGYSPSGGISVRSFDYERAYEFEVPIKGE